MPILTGDGTFKEHLVDSHSANDTTTVDSSGNRIIIEMTEAEAVEALALTSAASGRLRLAIREALRADPTPRPSQLDPEAARRYSIPGFEVFTVGEPQPDAVVEGTHWEYGTPTQVAEFGSVTIETLPAVLRVAHSGNAIAYHYRVLENGRKLALNILAACDWAERNHKS